VGSSADTSEVIIRVRDLFTCFGQQIIHDKLNLDVRRGEVLGVIGNSGTGKSILLKEIVGLIKPTAGTINVLGYTVGKLDRASWYELCQHWGVLFQDGALFNSLTVAQNIQVPLREYTNLSTALISDITRVKIAMVGLPYSAAAKYPSELSGGMRKRAGLARALALDPNLLFLDEPTAGLDPVGAAAFDELIISLQRSLGLTVFMVTHDFNSLATVCDRIAVLINRRVIVDTMTNLMARQDSLGQQYFQRKPRTRSYIG
jgi:phospholipid/cholesterol/gamma-HCH transport system ATP-binding protein